ncbi:hypothetical protein I6A60_39095 [Frankia sp. AgB1.9]|uniref:hypothetical protein n=1 Tax=unclassified Frankia TaxID=2632575 RepID=UPI00193363E5|nr:MULTISPECIES: hypothetical protein [unclassified Frankia]MBL7494604.1 hypothetical protein [Frankia sp. AgW1.1]MBL7553792.1 hypothetical protein [Frankia sp. AgB1.9]MBL7617891.1 hypothetical protein [Frankia sp. AgB1.8]
MQPVGAVSLQEPDCQVAGSGIHQTAIRDIGAQPGMQFEDRAAQEAVVIGLIAGRRQLRVREKGVFVTS